MEHFSQRQRPPIAALVGEYPMNLGMVGNGMHPRIYAGLLNANRGLGPALPQLDHEIEVQGGGEADTPIDANPVEATTGNDLRSDRSFTDVSVTMWWSGDQEAAVAQAEEARVPHVARSLDALVASVDGGLVCTLDGATHAELALPFLRAGKPVFITKPPTDDPWEAAELKAVAEANGTFFFSSSPWKWSPTIERLVAALEPLGTIRTVVATGPGIRGPFFYVIHQMELIQRVITAQPATVRCLSDSLRHHIEVRYDDGSLALVNGLRGAKWMRHIVAYAEDGYREAQITNTQRDEGMIRMLARFCNGVRDNQTPWPMARSVEAVQLLELANRSSESGGRELELTNLWA